MSRTGPPRTKPAAAEAASGRSWHNPSASPRSSALRCIRLGIAIPSDLLREDVRKLIDGVPDLEIVGDCRDEQQVSEMLDAETLQVLLLDDEGFAPDAVTVISRLRRRESPEVRILVLSTASTVENAEQVIRSGAWGLVAKDDFGILLRAIRAVAGGEMWASRTVTARAIEHLINPVEHTESRITERELQVADGVTRGLRNKEIARELKISEKTVKSHLNSIFLKLGLKGRIALALEGRDLLKSSSGSEETS